VRYLLTVTWESVWNVLRWVLAALVAGFIGQFGRSYALRLIERRRKASGPPPPSETRPQTPLEVQLEQDRLEAEAKIEKKRVKAEAKKAKKAKAAEDKQNES